MKIKRTCIDNRTDIADLHIHGDNIKVMSGIELNKFDVIDLDAYGIPADQIIEVLSSDFSGVVFVTAIQTMQGSMPKKILNECGFPGAISKKAPSLASRRGWVIIKQFLCGRGVKEITHRSKNRKHYFCFTV